MAPGRHFIALDSLRGLCAIIVALGHFPAMGLLLQSGFIEHSYLFVDFFFVLSGFVIAANYISRIDSSPSLIRFLWLRVGRLYPLHLAVFLAYFGFELVRFIAGSADAFTGDKQLEAIPTNLLLIHSLGIHEDVTWNRPSWSISCELFAYVTFAVSTLAAGKLRYLAYALITAGSFLVLAYFNDGGFLSTHQFGFFRCLAGFFAGVFVWRIWSALASRSESDGAKRPYWTMLEVLTVLVIIAFVNMVPFESVVNFAVPFLFGAAVLVFAFENGHLSGFIKHRVFVFLGTLSYSIYMVHQFLIDRLLNAGTVVGAMTDIEILDRSGEFVQFAPTGLWADLFAMAFIGMTVALSYLTYRFIEAPCRDYFRKIAPYGRDVKRAKPETPVASDGEAVRSSL